METQLELRMLSNKRWTNEDKLFIKKNMNKNSHYLAKRLGRTYNGVEYAKFKIRNNVWTIEDDPVVTEQSFNKPVNTDVTNEAGEVLMTFNAKDVVGSDVETLNNHIENMDHDLETLKKDLKGLVMDNSNELKELGERIETLRKNIKLQNLTYNELNSKINLVDRWCNNIITNQGALATEIRRNRSVRLKLWDWLTGANKHNVEKW